MTNLATNTSLNAKINEVKGEILSITNLAITTALAAVENKIPNVCNWVKRADYNSKNNEIENKITDTTPEFHKLTAENVAASLEQANLTSKNDIANFVKKTDFDGKLKNLNKKATSNKSKYLLVENEWKKIQTFDSSLFTDQSYLSSDGAQLCLVFQSIYKTIVAFSGLVDTISEWESKGLPNEKFTSDYIAKEVFVQNWYGWISLK